MSIEWNPNIRCLVSDVDETLAQPDYPMSSGAACALNKKLDSGLSLLLVSGGSLDSIDYRVCQGIIPDLRRQILVAHSNGVELVGYDEHGERLKQPFYSAYNDRFDDQLACTWRSAATEILGLFNFRPHALQPKDAFSKENPDPHDIMFDDRGVQITLRTPNACALTYPALPGIQQTPTYDFRTHVANAANEVLRQHGVPAVAHLAGSTAVDIVVKGVSKRHIINHALTDPETLDYLDLAPDDLSADTVEGWGDNFSPDSIADIGIYDALKVLVPRARVITFGNKDYDAPEGVLRWDGSRKLSEGVADFLINGSS